MTKIIDPSFFFTPEELASPDDLSSHTKMDPFLMFKLTQARVLANIPFPITSGFRTPDHNTIVGGDPDSSHLSGHAVDIRCTDSLSRSTILKSLITVGFVRIGIYPHHIHADVHPLKHSPRYWLGS